MQVSDWWMILSFYQNVLAVPVALVFFILLVRARTARRRLLYGALLVVAFLPHIQRVAGDYYFDYLCRTQAGEFIYRTVDNVEGILQMRPRDGSKDYFDRMRLGDIPEDPWGHTNLEARRPWFLFRKYQFFEKSLEGPLAPAYATEARWHSSMFTQPPSEARYVRYSGYDGVNQKTLLREFITRPKSQYGYTWRESGNLLTSLLNIHPGEIHAVHVASGEILATKKGFFRIRPMQLCAGVKDETFTFDFLSKVLIPAAK